MVSQMFTPREKLSHTEIYASGSGYHPRRPIRFLSREKAPPLENLPSLLCALLTRDMFAIAKFLVHTPFPFNLYDHLEPCQSRASSVVA